MAPTDGFIAHLKDGIADNAIGQVNTEERWGNYVIMKHAENVYSCLAHLKQGSIKVERGQSVCKGQPIGLCGNSGRSPYPHIHLQFQMQPDVGSPSISFEFSNVCVVGERTTFLSKGMLEENTIVQNLGQTKDTNRFFPYALNKEWGFDFNGAQEIWKMEVDFYGNTVLVASQGTLPLPKMTKLSFNFLNGVLRVNQLEGNRSAGLYLFGSLVSEIPFAQHEQGLQWSTIDPTDYGVNAVFARCFDLLSLMGLGLLRRLDCETQLHGSELMYITRSSVYLKTPFRDFRLKQHDPAELVFVPHIGLMSISFGDRKLQLRQSLIDQSRRNVIS